MRLSRQAHVRTRGPCGTIPTPCVFMPPAKTSYFENQREKVEDGKTFCLGVRGRWLSRCGVVLLRRVRTSDVGSWKGTVGVWVRYLRKTSADSEALACGRLSCS